MMVRAEPGYQEGIRRDEANFGCDPFLLAKVGSTVQNA